MLQIKNTLGGGKPEGLYAWKKSEIGSELKVLNESVSSLPYNFYRSSAVVLNGEIHVLGSGYSGNFFKHYKWNGTSWTSVGTLPYSFYRGSAVVLNGEIHILGSGDSSHLTKHYKFDGSSWTSVSTLPYAFYDGSAVVFDNEIHILGGGDNSTKHYKFDGSSWTSVSTLSYNFSNGSALVLDNEIHILGGGDNSTKHYKWNGTSWTSISTLPYSFYSGSAVVFDNEIHILGGGGGSTKYYKWDGTSWTSVSTLPYGFTYGSVVVFDNGIHILGSSNSSYYTAHYLVYGPVTVYTFLDYIVSDKENAYPDGGEKGGYWYEKVGGGFTSGELTLASSVSEITIEHGLGKIPTWFVLASESKPTAQSVPIQMYFAPWVGATVRYYASGDSFNFYQNQSTYITAIDENSITLKGWTSFTQSIPLHWIAI